MNIASFCTLFAFLSIFYCFLGLKLKRFTLQTTKLFNNRYLTFISTIYALLATQLGSSLVLGTAQEAYSSGLYSLLYITGTAIGFIILGSGIAQRLKKFNVASSGELLETHYNLPILKKIASLLSIITMIGFLTSEIVASKTMLANLDFGNEFIFIGFWLLIIFYTALSGENVFITDMVQLVFFILIFIGIFTTSLFTSSFSISALLTHTPLFTVDINSEKMISLLLLPALYLLIEYDYIYPFFPLKSRISSLMASICASVIMILFTCIPLFFGMCAHFHKLNTSTINPLIVGIRYFTNDFFFIIALCSIIIALASAADSLLYCISATVTSDLWHVDSTKKNSILAIFIGLCALIISYFVSDNIISLILSSYELYTSCLLIPVLLCYFIEKPKKFAAIFSIIFGLIGFILQYYITIPFIPEVFSILLSTIGYCLGWCLQVFISFLHTVIIEPNASSISSVTKNKFL